MFKHMLLAGAMASLTMAAQLSAGQVDEVENVIQDEYCRIEFDRKTGSLRQIANLLIPDDCLKGVRAEVLPFRIYSDFTADCCASLSQVVQQCLHLRGATRMVPRFRRNARTV